MTAKTLLIFAHPGEAQAFYEAGLLNTDILICREGSSSALFELTRYLSNHQDQYATLVNLGVAGSLMHSVEVSEIYSIKTVYGENDFKSFSLADGLAKHDVVSAHSRIKKSEDKKPLKLVAPIVDRELWSLAYVANKFHLPLYSFKLISDLADESVDCEDIQGMAKAYSGKLLKYYQNFFALEKKSETRTSLIPAKWDQHFHFSVTQKNKLSDCCDRLKLQGQTEIFTENFLNECKDSHSLPKERSNYLLRKLTLKLNPMMENLENKLSGIVSPLTEIGAKVNFSPDFEENYFNLSMKIEHEKNLTRLSEALIKIDFGKFVRSLEGEQDV